MRADRDEREPGEGDDEADDLDLPAIWMRDGRSCRYHHAWPTVNAGADAATGATVANRPLRTATSSSAVAVTSSAPGGDRLGARDAVVQHGADAQHRGDEHDGDDRSDRPDSTGQNSDASRVLP